MPVESCSHFLVRTNRQDIQDGEVRSFEEPSDGASPESQSRFLAHCHDPSPSESPKESHSGRRDTTDQFDPSYPR